MVVFQGQTGSIGGHSGTCVWASDTGAQFRFNEYGDVTFNSNGFGENSKVTVQLGKEYNKYFCSVSTCGGFKNWVSSLGAVTPKTIGCRVSIIVFDAVTHTPVEGARVCVGLMCQNTPSNGEVYLGQFAFGTYTLTISKAGYDTYTEQLTLASAELRTSRLLTPESAIPQTLNCDQWPALFKPVCVVINSLVYHPLLALINAISPLLTKFKEELTSFVQSSIAGISATVGALVDDVNKLFSEVWASISAIDDILEELDHKIDYSIAGVWDKLEAWLIERLVGLMLKALDREVEREVKK